jgi:hypothetical protein
MALEASMSVPSRARACRRILRPAGTWPADGFGDLADGYAFVADGVELTERPTTRYEVGRAGPPLAHQPQSAAATRTRAPGRARPRRR